MERIYDMGLYFEGKPILEEEMWKKYLGAKREDLSVKPLEPSERLWIWTNLNTGKTVITGDEGNGWCIPLYIADSKEEAIQRYIENPVSAKYPNLFETFELLTLRKE